MFTIYSKQTLVNDAFGNEKRYNDKFNLILSQMK